jgi:multiple sugar transport system permease protein
MKNKIIFITIIVFNITWILFFMAPYLWMFLTSVLPSKDLTSTPPVIELNHVNFNTYFTEERQTMALEKTGEMQPALLTDKKFLNAAINSVICAIGSTLLTLIVSAPAAYALARLRIKRKNAIIIIVMGALMLPPVVMIIPLFILLRFFGLLDTRIALIITITAFLAPLSLWMLRAFFEDIEKDLEEAARIDGCSRMQALWRIIVPLSTNGLVAAGMLTFVSSWSDFVFPLYLTNQRAKTLPVQIAEFEGLYNINYAQGAASAILVSMPIVILAIIMQRWIIKGISEGSVKG